jgi:hypothetical protein
MTRLKEKYDTDVVAALRQRVTRGHRLKTVRALDRKSRVSQAENLHGVTGPGWVCERPRA